MTIQETLNEREKIYGDFGIHARAVQAFKSVYRAAPSWSRLTAVQREALEQDIVKTCRILYGDPTYADTWHDKTGYAMLATEEFARVDRAMEPPAEPRHPVDLDSGPLPMFLTEEKP